MKKALLGSFVALGTLAFAASGTIKVNIFQDSVIEGKALKAGQYKLSMENGNAVLTAGKQSVSVPAREETEPNKISSTQLIFTDSTNLQAIRVGGTNTKIVFDSAAPARSGM